MTTYTYSVARLEEGSVTFHEINDRYVAVRLKGTHRIGSFSLGPGDRMKAPKVKNPKFDQSGIMTHENFASFEKGNMAVFERFVALTPDQREMFRRDFYTNAWQAIEKEDVSPYETAINGGDKILARMKTDSHQLEDIDGNPMAVAFHFDYIDAGLDNRNYHLKDVFEILKARDDLIWRDGRYEAEGPEIVEIPYYNQDEGRTRYIDVMWAPSEEDYRKVWDWCHENAKASHPMGDRYYAVRVLDLLGIEHLRKEEE